MAFRDRWEECASCGQKYVFTVELQRNLQGAGGTDDQPPACPDCAPRESGGLVVQTQMRLDPVTGHWVGSVKWFDLTKGYGFIDRGDGSDIFFHKSVVTGDPVEFVEGQSVTYDVEETTRGPQAIEVQIYQS